MTHPNPDAISVMLVDDSAVIRGLMARALKQKPELHIAATANDGEMAIEVAKLHAMDVIVLDIEMPKMDGLTALPKLQELRPGAAVLIVSTLSQRNAEITMRALALGAADYIPKPTSQEGPQVAERFYDELRQKVVALGVAARQGRLPKKMAAPAVPVAAPLPLQTQHHPAGKVRAIAIASSTGGPQALAAVLHGLKGHGLQVPIFITQHMPPRFTTMLADHIARDTGLPCREGQQGEAVEPGTIYIAPGDYHMLITQSARGQEIMLSHEPPVNFCRPAADPMLISLARIYRDALLVVVLTGMGSDGLNGAREVVAAGGVVIAQDEATSVVWGMPGAVANAGLCKAILPLDAIAPYLLRTIGGAI